MQIYKNFFANVCVNYLNFSCITPIKNDFKTSIFALTNLFFAISHHYIQ